MKEVKFKSFSAKATALKRAILCSAGYNLFSVKKVTIGARRTGILFTDISMKFDGKLVGKFVHAIVFQRDQQKLELE